MRRNKVVEADYDVILVTVSLDSSTVLKDVYDTLVKLADRDVYGKAWLVFLGCDDDPRELWQIPECVRFAQIILKLCSLDPRTYRVLADDRRGFGPGLGLSMLLLVAGQGTAKKSSSGNFDAELTPDASMLVELHQGTLKEVN